MSQSETEFLARARAHDPADREVRVCWRLLIRGIEVGWLDNEDCDELIAYLKKRGDFGVEELLFAHIGERLRVSFLDDVASCPQAAFIQELDAFLTRK
jgi:hypothetical protein